MEQLEIHIKNGLCKVFQGDARRVFYSTEEAVALALLRINPAQDTGSIQWMDFLSTHGIAIGQRGATVIAVMVYPAKMRTVQWRAISSGQEPLQSLDTTFPPLLILTQTVDATLVKSFMYVIRPGKDRSLTVTRSDPCLAPFPYGNVHTSGKICWGTVATNGIIHPSDMEDLFFKSGFNGDLWHGSEILGVDDESLADLVKRTEGHLPSPPAPAHNISMLHAMEELA